MKNKEDLKELGVSTIRTAIVPPIAARILQWLAAHQIGMLSQSAIFTGVTIFITGIWYLTFRGLELLSKNTKVKRLAGIFLGYPRF